MPRIDISGIGIEYELLGQPGQPTIALIPGGRYSYTAPGVERLGQALADGGYRVLLWDRPNCGASDLSFAGPSEAGQNAAVLVELIRQLDLGPAVVAGGSAGSRVAMLAALKAPELVSHLVLWWISGGPLSLLMLGASYCSEPAIAASMGGMEAVVALPAFAEQIARNPRNRDYILGWEPHAFVAQMEQWSRGFLMADGAAMPGFQQSDADRLTMPVLIFGNAEHDLFHPAKVSDAVHAMIPHARLLPAPWPDDTFERRQKEAIASGTGMGHFLDWHLLAPQILDFCKAG